MSQQSDLEELRNELKIEARENDIKNSLLKKDYDAFQTYYNQAFEDAKLALKYLDSLHKQYEHEFDCRELL